MGIPRGNSPEGTKARCFALPTYLPYFPYLMRLSTYIPVLVIHIRYFRLLRGYRPVAAIYCLLHTILGDSYTAIYPSCLSYFLSTYLPFPAFQNDVPAFTTHLALLSSL